MRCTWLLLLAPSASPLSLLGRTQGAWPVRSGDAQHTGRAVSAGPGFGGPVFLWASPPLGSAISTSPAIGAGGAIFVGTAGGVVAALSSAGRLLWTHAAGAQVNDSPALTDDGRVLVGTSAGRLLALDATTGLLNFSFQTGAASVQGAPTIAGSCILFGARDGYAYALNATGGLAWRFNAGAVISASPAVSADGATAYFATEDPANKVFALDVASGAVRWSFTAADAMWASPLVMPDDGSVVVVTTRFRYNLHRLNATSGAPLWTFNVRNNVLSSPSLTLGGLIVFGRRCCDSGMVAINATLPREVWSFQAYVNYDATPLVGADGTIYVRGGGSLFGLNAGTGARLFAQSTNMSGDTSVALAADGTLVVGDGAGVVRGYASAPSPSASASASTTPTVSASPTPSRSPSPSSTLYPYPDDGFMAGANLTWVSTSGPGASAFDGDTCTRECSRQGFALARVDRARGVVSPRAGARPPQYIVCCGFLCLGSCYVDCACPSGALERPDSTALAAAGTLYDAVRGTTYAFTTAPAGGSAVAFKLTSPAVVLVFNASTPTLGLGISPSATPTPSATPAADDGFMSDCALSHWATEGAGAAAFDADACSRACSRAGFALSRTDRYTGALARAAGPPPTYTACCGFLCLDSCTRECTCPSGALARTTPFAPNATGTLFDTVRARTFAFTTSLPAGAGGNAVAFAVAGTGVTLTYNASPAACLGLRGGLGGGEGAGAGAGAGVGAIIGGAVGGVLVVGVVAGTAAMLALGRGRAAPLVKGRDAAAPLGTAPPAALQHGTANPLLRAEQMQPPVTRWHRFAEGGDVWYEDVNTGVTAWDMPPGGVLVGSS